MERGVTGETFSISLGPTADQDVAETLVRLGVPHEDAGHFQMDARAISRLHVRGLLADEAARKARKFLFKRMEQALGVVRR